MHKEVVKSHERGRKSERRINSRDFMMRSVSMFHYLSLLRAQTRGLRRKKTFLRGEVTNNGHHRSFLGQNSLGPRVPYSIIGPLPVVRLAEKNTRQHVLSLSVSSHGPVLLVAAACSGSYGGLIFWYQGGRRAEHPETMASSRAEFCCLPIGCAVKITKSVSSFPLFPFVVHRRNGT